MTSLAFKMAPIAGNSLLGHRTRASCKYYLSSVGAASVGPKGSLIKDRTLFFQFSPKMTYTNLTVCSSGPEARICIFLIPFERKHFEVLLVM
jgi:hypothetical protein